MQGRCTHLKSLLSPEPTCKYLLNKMRKLRGLVQSATLKPTTEDPRNIMLKQSSILNMASKTITNRTPSYSVWNRQRRQCNILASALLLSYNQPPSSLIHTTSFSHSDGSEGGKGGNSHGSSTYAAPAALLAGATVVTATEDQSEEDNRLKITDEQVEGCVDDLEHMLSQDSEEVTKQTNSDHYIDEWVHEFTDGNIIIWSRPIINRDYREYKVHGRYDDIPAVAFFYIQSDLLHRKQWDTGTDEISLIDNTVNCPSTELVYWRVHSPIPFVAKRDYVYIRRMKIDIDRNVLFFMNSSAECKKLPENEKDVRVTDYDSKMIIKPHKSYTENGFDYVMTYYDDMKTRMSMYALKKVVRRTLPRFLDQVHRESSSLWSRYTQHDFSSAESSKSGDSQVIALRDLIVESERSAQQARDAAAAAERRQVETARAQAIRQDERLRDEETHAAQSSSPESAPTGDRTNLKADIQKRISKITPPKYLPDIRKYIHDIIHEKKFYPIPMMLVHADEQDGYSQRNRRTHPRRYPPTPSGDHSEGFPLYQGTKSPPPTRNTKGSDNERPPCNQRPGPDNVSHSVKTAGINARQCVCDQTGARQKKNQTKPDQRRLLDIEGNMGRCSCVKGCESSQSFAAGSN